jgi:hypothetical protein
MHSPLNVKMNVKSFQVLTKVGTRIQFPANYPSSDYNTIFYVQPVYSSSRHCNTMYYPPTSLCQSVTALYMLSRQVYIRYYFLIFDHISRAIFLLEIFKQKLLFIYSFHATCTTHHKFLHSFTLIIL